MIKYKNRMRKGGDDDKPSNTEIKGTEAKSSGTGVSPSKTPTKSTKDGVSSYIQAGGKALECPEILTIEELLDLPIPIFSKESIRRAYYGSEEMPVGRSDAFLVDPYGRCQYDNEDQDRLEDEDTLGKRFGSRLTFDDIMKGLTKKLVAWNQFVFSQKALSHLQERPNMVNDKHLV